MGYTVSRILLQTTAWDISRHSLFPCGRFTVLHKDLAPQRQRVTLSVKTHKGLNKREPDDLLRGCLCTSLLPAQQRLAYVSNGFDACKCLSFRSYIAFSSF